MIELSEILPLCKSKNFDLLRINYKIGDIETIRNSVVTILDEHDLVKKDGYKTYEAIGMQYADESNPLYDAVQQTAFVGGGAVQEYRKPMRYTEQNEIGKEFGFVYDLFSDLGIGLERGRVLKANPGHRHSDHLDYDIRIHLPVITNPDCQMVYGDNQYHMPADGYIYLINGFRLHHFFNHGTTERVHLVWLIQKDLYKEQQQ